MGVACSTAQASSPELRHVQVKESSAAAHGAMVKAQMELAMQMAAAAVAPPTEHSHSHTHSHDDRNTYTHHSSFAPQQTAQRNELSKQQQPSPTPVLVEKEGVRSPQPPAALHSNHLLAPPVSTQRKRCASETFISACGSSSLMLPPANGALPRSHGQADAKAPSHPSGGVASQMSLLSLPHLSSPSTSCTTMAGSARSMIESMASPTSNKIELGGNGMGGGNGNAGSGLSARCTLQDAAAIVNAAQAQVQAQTTMTTLSLMSSASSAPLSPRSAGAALALAAAADSSSLCMSNLSLAEGGVVPALLLPWAVQQQRARALERGMEDLLSHPPLFLSLAEQPAGPGANPPNPPTRVQPLAVPSWSPFNSPRLAPGQQAPMLRRKLNTLALRHINMVLEGMSSTQLLSLSCHTKMQPPHFLTALNNPGACTTVAQRLRPPTGMQATPTSSPMPFATLPPAALLASPQLCAAESQMGSMSPIATPASLQTAPNSVVLAACASPNGATNAAGVSFISLDSHSHAHQQCAPASENLAQLEYRLSLLVAKSEWKSARIAQPLQKLSLFGRDAYKHQGAPVDQLPAVPHPDEAVPLLGEGGVLQGCKSVFGFLREMNGASLAASDRSNSTLAISAPTSTLLCSVTASASPLGSPVSSRASPTPGPVHDTAHYLSSTCPSPVAAAAAAAAVAVAVAVVPAPSTPVRCGRRAGLPASTSSSSSQQSTPTAQAAGVTAAAASRSRRPSASLPSLSLSQSPDGAAASRIRVHVSGDSDEESSPEVGRRRVKVSGSTPPERTALVVPARSSPSPSAASRRVATITTSAVASALDASGAASAVAGAQQGQRERSLLLAQRPHGASSAGKLPGQADDSTVAAHARIARIDAC